MNCRKRKYQFPLSFIPIWIRTAFSTRSRLHLFTLPHFSIIHFVEMLITCSANARLPFRIPVISYLLINTCVGKYRFLYILDVSGTTVMTELYVLALLLLTTITGLTPPWTEVVGNIPRSAHKISPLRIVTCHLSPIFLICKAFIALYWLHRNTAEFPSKTESSAA